MSTRSTFNIPPSVFRATVLLLLAAMLFAVCVFLFGCAGGAQPARSQVVPGETRVDSEREERRPTQSVLRMSGASGTAVTAPAAAPPPLLAVPGKQDGLTPDQRAALSWATANGMTVDLVSTDMGSVKVRETGYGRGAGANAEGDKLSNSITGSAPKVGLSGGSGSEGGGVESTSQGQAWSSPASPWANPLLYAGIALLLGCGVCVWQSSLLGWKPALFCGIAAACLIASVFYPAVLLFAAGIPIVLFCALYLRSQFTKEQIAETNGNLHEALRATVAAIEHPTVPAEAQKAVKDAVARESDLTDRQVIDDIKREDGIGKYAD